MTNNLRKAVDECRAATERGATREEIVARLHERGISIIDSMKVLKELYGLSLGEAKAVVTAHPAWISAVTRADVLHGEIVEALSKENN